MKTPTKRTSVQMGLQPATFTRNKQWMVDQDYTKTLSAEEQEWLGRFNQEYYKNHFESSEKDLHNTPELKKSCYSNENARNRDLYGIKQCVNLIEGDNSISDEDGNEISHLDNIADYDLGYLEVENRLDKEALKKRK